MRGIATNHHRAINSIERHSIKRVYSNMGFLSLFINLRTSSYGTLKKCDLVNFIWICLQVFVAHIPLTITGFDGKL